MNFADKSIPLIDKIRAVCNMHLSGEPEVSYLVNKEPELLEIGCFGGLFVRKQYYPIAGSIHMGHLHNSDHISLVASGGVAVYLGDEKEPVLYEAPTFFEVPKYIEHKIIALVDDTAIFCIFNETEVETVEVENG